MAACAALMIGVFSSRGLHPIGNVEEKRVAEAEMRRPPQLRGVLPANRLKPTNKFRRCLATECIAVFHRTDKHVLTEVFEVDGGAASPIGAPKPTRRRLDCHQTL